MRNKLLLVLLALSLGACGNGPARLTTLGIDPALTSPEACPAWPAGTPQTDLESSDYVLSGYQAYRCERSTRLKIGEQDRRQHETP